MFEDYPYHVMMWSRDWSPNVGLWLDKLEKNSWRRYKDPLDYGEDTSELDYYFKKEEDALAFKIRFGSND